MRWLWMGVSTSRRGRCGVVWSRTAKVRVAVIDELFPVAVQFSKGYLRFLQLHVRVLHYA